MGEDEASAETHKAPNPPKKKPTLLRRIITRTTSTMSRNISRPSENNKYVDADGNEAKHEEQPPRHATAASDDNDGEQHPAYVLDTMRRGKTAYHRSHVHHQQQKHPDGQERTKWSWVGSKSPLLDSREEAEWILDRLQAKLLKELQASAAAQKQEQKQDQRAGRGSESLSGPGARFEELQKEEDPIAERTK